MSRFTPRVPLAVLAWAWCCGLGAPADLVGQEPRVELNGRGEPAVDRRLAELLDSGPVIVAVDTRLAASDTVHGPVLVLDATLIVEGVIRGDLAIVDAGAFIRPGAVIEGDVINAGGGMYLSELATIGGRLLDFPTAEYTVRREPDRLVILASGAPGPIRLDGLYGFEPPTYDRVNGVTPTWGGTLVGPHLGPIEPALRGRVGWHTERGEPTYAGELSLRWGPTSLRGGHERASATNEHWIRGDLRNSVNYLWDGDDFRDYHQIERSWAGIFREFGDPERPFFARLGVRGQVEDAESLAGGQPWHLWGDTVRPNPPIDDGRTTSVIADGLVAWTGRTTTFEGVVAYEAARSWMDGDFEFDRVVLTAEWAMQALANHTLEIELHGQVPIGGDSLPRQRWSFVGGSGTLQTTDFAAFRGDRVVFLETSYRIPLPERWRLPLFGVPELRLVHGAGAAWTADEDRDLHQEIGVRLDLFAVYFRYMIEPSNTSNTDLDIGITLPFGGAYPWED